MKPINVRTYAEELLLHHLDAIAGGASAWSWPTATQSWATYDAGRGLSGAYLDRWSADPTNLGASNELDAAYRQNGLSGAYGDPTFPGPTNEVDSLYRQSQSFDTSEDRPSGGADPSTSDPIDEGYPDYY